MQDLDPHNKPREYDFARVYDTRTEQEEVFNETKDIILSVIDGYNICIMAYGQTGSGKTWTMMGPVDNPGVNRRAIVLLLSSLKSQSDQIDFQIEAAQLEVYNEGVYDLLSTAKREDTKIKPRQLPKGVDLPNLTWRPVETEDDMYKVRLTYFLLHVSRPIVVLVLFHIGDHTRKALWRIRPLAHA